MSLLLHNCLSIKTSQVVVKECKPRIETMATSHRGYSFLGHAGPHMWTLPGKGDGRERAMIILYVLPRLPVWRSPLPHTRVSLGFMEESDKLNTRETDIELLCSGQGDTLAETAVPVDWTAQGSVQEEGNRRALRAYVLVREQWIMSAK